MKKETIWQLGPTALKIHSKLSQILRYVEDYPEVYLSNDCMTKVGVRKQDWDLADTDDFFACMMKEEFTKLSPSDPEPDPDLPFVTYEEVKYPDSDPPYNVFELEDCAFRVEIFFKELQIRKASVDGYGTEWPVNSSIWVPRERCKYEDLRGGSRMPPSVPWVLHRAYYNDNKPHQLYHARHGDEGKDGVVLRSELEILLTCMQGRMASPALCMHNIPILLLSIHGTRARIMIAHFNLDTWEFDLKCSKFEQFDGFEAKEGEGSRDGRARPHDFEAKRDLFFRWLNPVCQGNTYLEDTKEGEELMLRGRKGRKRLVPRSVPPKSTSSESSETVE